ncbi:2-amino-4-hydroxy-6-hydroxymethyldihydropteridine pyrophosphokinase [Rippkaea orientalis PCC 8801]|uniref:2-amino-4-hydroxy-6-hydroxymethyldihydropteridine diphosphokinase n=1 Tax=Rippkaea orientalis (strain PCC 8801 / RF-1) TaxID=41431 RepID=B7JY45_RIPO1|nr:2-amino-4-hydroxy-6-hydroxymethyldihydropteridine diphosphokinase [Rippkaea orientalis]ACK67147.1 2-amino-4-hydroxy-6-hydroxymethyldihydropteridine pyrophosphokinase [Rippkaea orientalis PCC 8801]
MNHVLLSVGSNINPVENFRAASTILAQEQILVDCTQPIVTKPHGYPHQPDFLNGAFYLKTTLDLPNLNRLLKTIEKQLGRVKTAIKSGPRTIDLDIIIWNGEIVRDEFYHYEYVYGPISELAQKHGIILQAQSVGKVGG